MNFTVKAGTPALVLSMDEAMVVSKKSMDTTKENVFDDHEVRIDPTGILVDKNGRVSGPNSQSVGGKFAIDGLYGFLRDGKMLIVHKDLVEVSGQIAEDIGDVEEEEEESSE